MDTEGVDRGPSGLSTSITAARQHFLASAAGCSLSPARHRPHAWHRGVRCSQSDL